MPHTHNTKLFPMPFLLDYNNNTQAISLSVPISKMKSICRDHRDASVFGIIVHKSDSASDVNDRYKLYLFEAEEKIVRSVILSLTLVDV